MGECLSCMDMVTSTTPRLTQEQVHSYRREGYLLPGEPVLDEDRFLGLKQHFEQKLKALPPDERPEGMHVPHFSDPSLFQWLFSDEILNLVEPITGPDI